MRAALPTVVAAIVGCAILAAAPQIVRAERCDGRDDDGDGLTDEDYPTLGQPCDGADLDECAYGTWTCAADGDGVACTNEDPRDVPELCDGVDNDCDHVLPADERDDDGDGYLVCEGDCDDGSVLFSPGQAERCDGFDNDCDGVLPLAEQDLDGDGHLACAPCPPYVRTCEPFPPDDCDDLEPSVYRGHPEVCDGLDNDCDGATDTADADLRVPRVDSYYPIGVPAGSTDPLSNYHGPQTREIRFYGKNFVPAAAAQVDFGPHITVDEVEILSTQELRVTITVPTVPPQTCEEGEVPAPVLGDHTIRLAQGHCVVVVTRRFDVYSPYWQRCPDLTGAGAALLAGLLLLLGGRAVRRRGPALAGRPPAR